jgi:DNA-3-methyladenine glycosylase II
MARKKIKWDFEKVCDHFELKDTKLASVMKQIGPLDFHLHEDHFHSLCSAIISQQVSTKAAASIKNKLIEGLGGALKPEILVAHSKEELRVFGISNQKAGYLIDLSEHFIKDAEKFARLPKMSDEEVIQTLVEVKGIGVWTAQMFLMFTLGRPDVFAPLDLGLKNAMIKLYGWKTNPDKTKLEKTSLKWSPYRTVASMYLWRSL